MAVIRVDFDELMQFGRTYTVMSDSLEKHVRVFEFDASKLDQAVRSFGVQLSMTNDQFNGMSIAQASVDGLARSRRVAEYLNDTGSTLYRHAGAVNAQDSRFDWLGMLDGAIADGVASVAGIGLTGLASSTAGMTAFGAVFGTAAGMLVGPVVLIVLGGSVIWDKASDVLDGGDFWEQFADVLGLASGVIMVVVGVGAIVAGIALGIAAAPVILAISGVALSIAALAAAGSWAIDNRSEIWEGLSNAGDNLKKSRSDIWDFGEVALSAGLASIPTAMPIGMDITDTALEAHGAVDDIGFITRFGGTPLADVGALDRLGGTDFGPLSIISAGRAAVAVPQTLEGIGGSWQEGEALGVARDLGELVDHGGTMASLVAPGYGTVVAMGAKSFVAGLDIGDWIDERTGFSDFAADSIYDVLYGGASQ